MKTEEKVSLLWIVVMFNMAFADILTFILPGSLQEIMTGSAGDLKITQGLLLVFAILIEVPIAMIFLSRVLRGLSYKITQITASAVTILFVVGGGSLTYHYIFFAAVEVICMVGIIIYTIKPPKEISP